MINRHLPKKCKRILIKPFYGYIEETFDRSLTQLYRISHEVKEYRSHTNIHAYGVWGEAGLEILLHRITGSSADTVNIACDLIKLK